MIGMLIEGRSYIAVFNQSSLCHTGTLIADGALDDQIGSEVPLFDSPNIKNRKQIGVCVLKKDQIGYYIEEKF